MLKWWKNDEKILKTVGKSGKMITNIIQIFEKY